MSRGPRALDAEVANRAKLPVTDWRPSPMHKFTATPRRKKPPRQGRALPDFEQSKAAVLNSLISSGGQPTYDHAIRGFVTW